MNSGSNASSFCPCVVDVSADGHNGTPAVDVELFDVDIPEYRARRLKVKLKPEFAPGRGISSVQQFICIRLPDISTILSQRF